MNDRRVARICIGTGFLTEVLKAHQSAKGDGLPQEFKVVRVYQEFEDEWSGRFWVLIESDELTPVPEGGLPPIITPTYTTITG